MREGAISGRITLNNEKKVEVKKKGVLVRIQTLEITGRGSRNQAFILTVRWNIQCRCEKEMENNTENSRWSHEMAPKVSLM